MKHVYRLSGLLGLLGLVALAGCGGGGSTSASSAPAQDSFAGGGSNVVAMSVQPGPAQEQPFNQPMVSVKVCVPNSGTCGTISGVLVDTGSYGLRIMASALAQANVSLPAMADPLVPVNTIQECLPFADGFAWGQVSLADVSIGGETTSGSVPVQIINDSNPQPSNIPASCQSWGANLDSVNALGVNGVLGVGVFSSDCGSTCETASGEDIYYSCTSAGSCSQTAQSIQTQVSNPVAFFPTDNNGVILQLPPIGNSGAATASGYLVFGIGTETNNGLASAKILTANGGGNFTTNFAGQSLTNSFIDSGSNALFFNDSALQGYECYSDAFYCPPSTTNLSATNQGQNGTTSDVSFSVESLNSVSQTAFALDDVAGPAPTITNFGAYFDWGLPFFYGRTIYFAIEGASAGGTTGPYYAY